MHYAVCYDIACNRRRRRLARVLEGYGQRLHESAFVMRLRDSQLRRLEGRVQRMIDAETDRVAIWPLCRRDVPDIVHLGLSQWPLTDGAVIV